MLERTRLEIEAELERDRAIFPTPHQTFRALVEVVGKLATALIDCKPGDAAPAHDVYHEAMQVAVMAIRVMEDGDSETPAYCPYLGMPDR